MSRFRLSFLLLLLTLLFLHPMAFAGNAAIPDLDGHAVESEVGAYRGFLIYPHLQRGFDAMKRGDKKKAIQAFEHAHSLASSSPGVALYLADAYRRFGQTNKAKNLLLRQARITPEDKRVLAALKALRPSGHGRGICERLGGCPGETGGELLRAGDLEGAEALLEGEFAASRAGIGLRREIAQRAIYIGQNARAERQFEELHRAGEIRWHEREQWFNLLLARGALSAAGVLLRDEGFATPLRRLAYADAVAVRGNGAALAAYLAGKSPNFSRARDERRWLWLLQRVQRQHPELLLHFRPRFAANRAWHARLAVPLAIKRNADPAGLLASLPDSEFQSERFEIALEKGQWEAARKHAEAIIDRSPDDTELVDSLTYKLVNAGAGPQSLRLLMKAYPFAGTGKGGSLYQRLAMLAVSHPDELSQFERLRLRRPLPEVEQRDAQASLLAMLADCDGVREVLADSSPQHSASAWRSLGDCHRAKRPGLAEFAYAEAWKREPGGMSARALGYQAYETKNLALSLQAWQSLSPTEMSPQELMAAATTALDIGDELTARGWLDIYAERNPAEDDAYWWLRARVQETDDPLGARTALERAIKLRKDARYYARMATWQEADGQMEEAVDSLSQAVRLSPEDASLRARLAYAFRGAGRVEPARDQMRLAQKASPRDPGLAEDLVYLSLQTGDVRGAGEDLRRAMDILQDEGDELRGFRLRRMHEQLGRSWQINMDTIFGNSTSSAANASAPGTAYRSYAQIEAQYWMGQRLGRDDGDALAAYARAFSGSGNGARLWPTEGATLGVGLRWKPWRKHGFFFSLEQQKRLGEENSRSETMLRASASLSKGERYSSDWHVQDNRWNSHSIYLDAAHYLRSKHSVLTADYQFGVHRKIGGASTLEPYFRLQYNGKHSGKGFDLDSRVGMGLRWNLWYGQSRYDAYRHRFTVGLEWQYPLRMRSGEKNVVFLALGNRW